MSGTFSKLHVQVVFAVKHRNALILPSWEERLHKYITGIVQKNGQKMLAINGMPDHIHIFIGMKPECRISDLVREIKKSSNTFINEGKFTKQKFYWQEGYGAFTYSQSQIDRVVKYIMRQKEHHSKTAFKSEYIGFLKKFEISYEDRFLFDWIEYSNLDI